MTFQPTTNDERPTLRLGTRQSPLALAQAELTRQALTPFAEIEIVPFTTTGDKFLEDKLTDVGGKGLFTKELEDALLHKKIDLAVHSVKDMQTVMPPGLVLTACLEREDARDVLVGAESLQALPLGARVGTSSLRRVAQLKYLRPDLNIVVFRGNVGTRLKKLAAGEADATLLALAGLKRLGHRPLPQPLDTKFMLPAVGQGAIGLQCREDDTATREILAKVNHAATLTAITAERAFLRILDGSCRTPIAGYATLEGDMLTLEGKRLSEDGKECFHTTIKGAAADAKALGEEAGRAIRK